MGHTSAVGPQHCPFPAPPALKLSTRPAGESQRGSADERRAPKGTLSTSLTCQRLKGPKQPWERGCRLARWAGLEGLTGEQPRSSILSPVLNQTWALSCCLFGGHHPKKEFNFFSSTHLSFLPPQASTDRLPMLCRIPEVCAPLPPRTQVLP